MSGRLALFDLGELLWLPRLLFLLRAERGEEFLRQILSFGQRAMAESRPLAGLTLDKSGIGAEKGRRGSDNLAAIDDEIQRQVMSFDAPAPFAALGGRAENGDEV